MFFIEYIRIRERGRAFLDTVKIAIDGPAGAGKSTVAKVIAKHLGYVYIDTGAMYRAVALKAIRSDVSLQDTDKIRLISKDLDITIAHNQDGQVIMLDGENVTKDIRAPEVSMGASYVASVLQVRTKLVDIQRALADKYSVVMDGRDIGTNVLPTAQIKIFLTASVEERAKRRYQEMIEKGSICHLEEVKKEIEQRDLNDRTRKISPLRVAEDAFVIDTSGQALEESIEKILAFIVQERNKINIDKDEK